MARPSSVVPSGFACLPARISRSNRPMGPGQGVATIHDVPSVAALVERIAAEYRAACALPPSPALRLQP